MHCRKKIVDLALSVCVGAQDLGMFPPNDCLRWASWVGRELTLLGAGRVIIQAGSARFPLFADPDALDENGCSHFSYEWSLREAIPKVEQGLMPEIHCWVAFPDYGLVVDPTCGLQPECAELFGLGWGDSVLPQVFIGDAKSSRDLRISYQPEPGAIAFAFAKMRDATDLWLEQARSHL